MTGCSASSTPSPCAATGCVDRRRGTARDKHAGKPHAPIPTFTRRVHSHEQTEQIFKPWAGAGPFLGYSKAGKNGAKWRWGLRTAHIVERHWVNFDDVVGQLEAGRIQRTSRARWFLPSTAAGKPAFGCKVEGARQEGWVSLHTIRLDDGRDALVGALLRLSRRRCRSAQRSICASIPSRSSCPQIRGGAQGPPA